MHVTAHGVDQSEGRAIGGRIANRRLFGSGVSRRAGRCRVARVAIVPAGAVTPPEFRVNLNGILGYSKWRISRPIRAMSGNAHLATWVCADAKQRFAAAAACQGLSESALLKRLVYQMLAASGEAAAPVEPVALRDARVSVRLVPEDRALLQERAAARIMPASTYVSVLVRAHLRHLAPLPDRELAALRSVANELAAIGRNLNTMARLLQQDRREAVPGRHEVFLLMKIGDVLLDRSRELVRANLVSWEVGHAEKAS